MSTPLWLAFTVMTGAAEAPPGEPQPSAAPATSSSDSAAAEAAAPQAEPVAAAAGDGGALRSYPEIEAPPPAEPAAAMPTAERPLPELLRRRSPGTAATLGAVVGFGTGNFYAGHHSRGTVYLILDTLLWASLTTSVVVFNQEVIHNDFKTGDSLKRGERAFTSDEKAMYLTSWGLVGALAITHLLQARDAYNGAHTTNTLLDRVRLTPLGAGAALGVDF